MRGIYAAKGWFGRVLSPITRVAERYRLSPDLFTVIGVGGGVLAGFGVAQVSPWIVLVGVLIRLAGANLDGQVARARGLTSPRGFWVNEAGDRLADFAIFAGFIALTAARVGGPSPFYQLGATLVAAVPTLVSLWGHRAGVPRVNGGPFGKSERAFGSFVVTLALEFGAPLELTLESWAALVVFGSLLTAELRVRRIDGVSNGIY